MKLQWLGHSCFRLEESTGTSVITDPYSQSSTGYELPKVSADIITLSHVHKDHACAQAISGNPTILSESGTYDIKGINITTVSSFHDNVQGKRRGNNLIFKFRIDDITVAHLGDIGQDCSGDIVEQLLPVNILLIPVGGTYTIDADSAMEYVENLLPDVVIPMHFKTKGLLIDDIDKVDGFLRKFDSSQIIWAEEDVLVFDRNFFDGGKTKVIVPKLPDCLIND